MAEIAGWEITLDDERKIFGGTYIPDSTDPDQSKSLLFEFTNKKKPEQIYVLRLSQEALNAMNRIADKCNMKMSVIARYTLDHHVGKWIAILEEKDAMKEENVPKT